MSGAEPTHRQRAIGARFKFMKSKHLFILFAAFAVASVTAAPAAWYKWRSKLNGTTICTQVMHGEWEKVAGPFKDARCEKPGKPG